MTKCPNGNTPQRKTSENTNMLKIDNWKSIKMPKRPNAQMLKHPDQKI